MKSRFKAVNIIGSLIALALFVIGIVLGTINQRAEHRKASQQVSPSREAEDVPAANHDPDSR